MSKVVPLEGFGGGGSSPLNFKIVAYATEEELAAAQPKENTIGVITTTPISSWTFSAKKPFNTDTYDKYIVKNANTVLGVISGRTYTKTNDGIAAFAFIDNGSYVGPMLVSPIQDNAGYITSGNHDSTQTASDTVVYNGTTYYYPSGAWMGGTTLDGLTPAFSVSSNEEAALMLAEIYENALAEKEEVSKYEGTVWFSTDVSSVGEFNALKKNSIQLCPTSAKQYINGDWIDKTAKSYINKEWISWFVFDGYLYKPGDECVDVTGGWSQVSYPGYSNGSVSKGSSEIAFRCSSNNQAAVIQTNNKINFKDFKTLTVNITKAQIEGSASSKMVVASAVNSAVQASLTISGTGKKSLSVEGVDGEYYVFIYALRPSGDFDVRFNEVTLT